MSEKTLSYNEEATKEFAKIMEDYNNPVKIAEKEQETKRKEILKEKKSSFIIDIIE